MYEGSNPNAAHGTVTISDRRGPPPGIRSINVRPPHTDAHETNESRNRATMRGSPLGVRSLFGSFLGGREARRRSARPPAPPVMRAGRPPSRVSGRPRPPSPAPVPPLVRRDGRYGGALRDSSARRSASAVGHR